MRLRGLALTAAVVALGSACGPWATTGSDGGKSSTSSSSSGSSSTSSQQSSSAAPRSSSEEGSSSSVSASSGGGSSSSTAVVVSSSSAEPSSSSAESSSGPGSSSAAPSSSAAESSSSMGTSSSAAAASSSMMEPVDAGPDCINTAVPAADLVACFAPTGACTEDRAARTTSFDDGFSIRRTGSGFAEVAEYESPSGPCFTTRFEAGVRVAVDPRGCRASGALPGLPSPVCQTVLPGPGECVRLTGDGGPITRSDAICTAEVPECCFAQASDAVGACVPVGFCQQVNGVVTGSHSSAMAAPDAGNVLSESQPSGGTPDTCMAATPLAADGTPFSGTTSGTATAFNLASNPACAGSIAPDALFRVHLTGGIPLRVTLTPTDGADLNLSAFDACPIDVEPAAACIASAERASGGDAEVLTLTSAEDRDIYVLVDGFAPSDHGAFTLVAAPAETCGDGLLSSVTCGQPAGPTTEIEYNGVQLFATPYGGGWPEMWGAFPAWDEDEDWYQFVLDRPAALHVTVTARGSSAACVGRADLELYSEDGTLLARDTVGSSQPRCPVLDSLLALPAPTYDTEPPPAQVEPGVYFIRLYTYGAEPLPGVLDRPYSMRIQEFAGGLAEDCAAATPLAVDTTLAGTTDGSSGGHHAFNVALNPLCGAGSTAPDQLYTVSVPQGVAVEVELVPADTSAAGPDFTLSALPSCPLERSTSAIGSCASSVNGSGPGGTERLVLYQDEAPSQDLLVLVDGFNHADRGAYTLTTRQLPVVCGDSQTVGPERCDDGNTVAGDGCSSRCLLETPTAEVEPNDAAAVATANGSDFPWFTGTISPSYDQDWFHFSLQETTTVVITAHQLGEPSICPVDLELTLYDASQNQLAGDDDSGVHNCPLIDGFALGSGAADLPPGRYRLKVNAYSSASSSTPYEIQVITPRGGTAALCSAAHTIIPSAQGTEAMGATGAEGDGFNLAYNAGCAGTPGPDAVLTATARAGVSTEFRLLPATDGEPLDLTLSVLRDCPVVAGPNGPACIPSLADTDGSRVVRVRPTVDTPYTLVVDALRPGLARTFRLRAQEFDHLCGDGVTSGTETCDDGNTAGSDGCSAVCEVEPDLIETEPNDTRATANPNPSLARIRGSVEESDVDYFRLTLISATALRIETGVPELADCSGTYTSDTSLRLYDASGNTLTSNDDVSGSNYCSRLTTSVLEPGDYYLLVDTYGGSYSAPVYTVFFTRL